MLNDGWNGTNNWKDTIKALDIQVYSAKPTNTIELKSPSDVKYDIFDIDTDALFVIEDDDDKRITYSWMSKIDNKCRFWQEHRKTADRCDISDVIKYLKTNIEVNKDKYTIYIYQG